ncbi:riboflavin synthase [Membranihabitans marinus]|uniref:riboflavin synthase n=1 Tax=Membranihabitans marinus TaxID=1227546 RepID=UPI001F18AB68|nr:riboflavin synthase [Membranihabitans marinus]
MFTGIVENLGEVVSAEQEQNNIVYWIQSTLTPEFKIDQSVSHDGVCLTVEAIDLQKNQYRVTAIDQTLNKTNLLEWKVGKKVNLERSVTLEHRLDGHMVQGHVDGTLRCVSIEEKEGSRLYGFTIPQKDLPLVVAQGSITLEGISLTIASLEEDRLKVAIIPYTYQHTTVQFWKVGQLINVEYDLFGKYFMRYMKLYQTT